MKILRELCIFIVIVTLHPRSSTQDDDNNKGDTKTHNDHETELLDKEYGVKYASACEGNYQFYSLIGTLNETPVC